LEFCFVFHAADGIRVRTVTGVQSCALPISHHGPVIEIDTWPKDGKPYVRQLEEKLVAVIQKADAARKPARYGVSSTEVAFNRNRSEERRVGKERIRRLMEY